MTRDVRRNRVTLVTALCVALLAASPLGAQRRLLEPAPPPPPKLPHRAPVIVVPVWGFFGWGSSFDRRPSRVDTVYVDRDTLPILRDHGVRAPGPMYSWQVDAPAVRVDSTPLPPYPASLAERRIPGRVTAQFVVDTEGVPDVRTFRVLYTTDRAFSEAILGWLSVTRYASARWRGVPVAQVVEETFTW